MNGNKKLPETPTIKICKKCNYVCSHKGDWNKHIRTAKHLNDNNDNNNIPKTPRIYKCNCNEFKHQQLVEYLLKENFEFTPLKIYTLEDLK